MAYTPFNPYVNPYYPMANQPMQQPQQVGTQMSVPQPPQNNQGLIWVSGEVGAKSYLVAPNTTVMLMDSESETFYLKSTDNAGMPSLRIFDYKERSQNVSQAPQSNSIDMSAEYVTRKEYEDLSGKYDALIARIDELQKPKTNSRKKEVESDE